MKSVLLIAAALWWFLLCSVVRSGSSDGIGKMRDTDDEISLLESQLMVTSSSQLLMVPLTLIQEAGPKGAGTLSVSLLSHMQFRERFEFEFRGHICYYYKLGKLLRLILIKYNYNHQV